MAVLKVSVSLDEHHLAAARKAAAEAGMSLSAWLSQAAADAARIAAGRTAVAEFEAEYGPFTEEERKEARRVLAELDAQLNPDTE
jgi:hypothetical protein